MSCCSRYTDPGNSRGYPRFPRGFKMRHLSGVIVTVALIVGSAATARAQVARVGGFVRDDAGQPIKGATIRADNPDAPLGTLTVATDDKGRFAIIGLARGEWSFMAEAPGFQSQFAELNIVRTGTPQPPL